MSESREETLRTFLGDARYYCDTGFADWQRAIAEYSPEASPMERVFSDQLLNARDHFVSVRQMLTEISYTTARQQMGESYSEKTPDERAAINAMLFLGVSLRSAPPAYN